MNLSLREVSSRTASAPLAKHGITTDFVCLYKPTELALPPPSPYLKEAECHGRRVTNVMDVAMSYSKMCLPVELPDTNPECDINFRDIPPKIMSMLLKARTAPHDFTVTSPTTSLVTLLIAVMCPDSSAYLVGDGVVDLEDEIWTVLLRKAQEAGYLLKPGRPGLEHLSTLGQFLGISIAVHQPVQNTFETCYYADYLPTLLIIKHKDTMRALIVDFTDKLDTSPRLIRWSQHEGFLLQLLTQPLGHCIDFSHAKLGDLRKLAADLGLLSSESAASKAQLTKVLQHHHVTLDQAKHIRIAAGVPHT